MTIHEHLVCSGRCPVLSTLCLLIIWPVLCTWCVLGHGQSCVLSVFQYPASPMNSVSWATEPVLYTWCVFFISVQFCVLYVFICLNSPEHLVCSCTWAVLCTLCLPITGQSCAPLCVFIYFACHEHPVCWSICKSRALCVLMYLASLGHLSSPEWVCSPVSDQTWELCVFIYLNNSMHSLFSWTWPVLCTECLGTWPVLSNLSVVVVVYAQSYALCVFLYLASPMHRVCKLLVQSWAPGVFLHLSSLVHLLCLPITGQSCAPALSQKMNSPVHMVCSYTYPVPCIWCVLVPA